MNKYETAIAVITNRAEHTLKTVISADTAQLAIEALGKQIPKSVMSFSEKNLDTKIYPCCKNICAYWEQKCCPFDLGYCKEIDNCCDNCLACWNIPLETELKENEK